MGNAEVEREISDSFNQNNGERTDNVAKDNAKVEREISDSSNQNNQSAIMKV